MTQTMGTLLPSFTVNARLAGHLAALAVGHSLVIGYFASRRCGVVSGDFTVSWGPKEPTRGYVALRPVESVPVFVDRRLLDVLRRADGRPCSLREIRAPPLPRRPRPRLIEAPAFGPLGQRLVPATTGLVAVRFPGAHRIHTANPSATRAATLG